MMGMHSNDQPERQPYNLPQPPPGVVPHRKARSSMAVWSLVLGIVGLIIGWLIFGVPSAVAVVLGAIAMSQTESGQREGRGMAVAGFTLGLIGTVVGIFTAIAVFTS